MKKTLIALMALAGVASADVTVYTKDQANAWLDAITANYTGDFTASITYSAATPGNNAEAVLTMASDFHIVSQHPSYVGLSGKADGGKTPTNGDISWVAPTSTVDNVNTFEFNSGKTYQWISFGNDGTSRLSNFSWTGATITLEYVAGGTSTLSIVSPGSNVTEKIVFTGGSLQLNASDLALGNATSGVTALTITRNGTTYTIPEPATATLSLLALAGLAARRRRH